MGESGKECSVLTAKNTWFGEGQMGWGKKRFFSFILGLGLAVALILGGSLAYPVGRRAWELSGAERADVVVYGGGLAACAAAWKAAATAPESRVVLIIPYLARRYGGLATVGGQNFWDVRYWQRDGRLPQGGSFAHWFGRTGSFYGTEELAGLIADDLGRLPNLITYWSMDVTNAYADRKSGRLKVLSLRSLERGADGYVNWGREGKTVEARQFIDASEDGRLSVLTGSGVTVGRADWPSRYLGASQQPKGPVPPSGQEEGDKAGGGYRWPKLYRWAQAGWYSLQQDLNKGALALLGLKEVVPSPVPKDQALLSHQQAATLMFKVKRIRPGTYRDMIFLRSEQGVWGAYGGRLAYSKNPVIRRFNETYGPRGFALKPLNAAQDGKDSPEWWVNALLIFHVDGRAHFRDRGTARYPADKIPGSLETDEAWVAARQMLLRPDFLEALRQFEGFEKAELVTDRSGAPVTGDILYLRETVHQVREVRWAGPGTEDSNYAVTTREAYLAGQGPDDGADAENYVNRVGLGFYWLDINAYQFEDLKGEGGDFRWPVTPYLRPDYARSSPGYGALPENPVYLPFEILLSPRFTNLLVPGVACGVSSLAWAELRVLPNQAVLGDAAGVAAAYAVRTGRDPALWTPSEVAAVREILVQKYNARVDK